MLSRVWRQQTLSVIKCLDSNISVMVLGYSDGMRGGNDEDGSPHRVSDSESESESEQDSD